jgi:hypothetical protein
MMASDEGAADRVKAVDSGRPAMYGWDAHGGFR